MRQANLGAVRPFATAAVLVLLAAPTFGQVVEKGRTFADLTASHPCTNGLTERIARVIDCDAADDVGDGGGAFQCWVRCDGSAPWETVAIGAGGGGLPGADEVTEAMLKSVNGPTDEYMLTYESTTGDFEWQAPATGDVVGPAGATGNKFPLWNGSSGKLLKDSIFGVSSGYMTGDGSPTGFLNTLSGNFGGMTVGNHSVDKGYLSFYTNGNAGVVGLEDHATNDFRLGLRATVGLCWVPSGFANDTENCNVGFVYVAPGIAAVSDGSPSGAGWLRKDGEKALNADFTSQSTTPENLTGLTVTLKTGRKYTFRFVARFSNSTAADGARFDFDGGTATATDFGVNCQVFDSALLISSDATALASDIVATTTTGAAKIVCDGSFTVNAAGTFIPRAGQEAASGGTLTVELGSSLSVTDASFN